MNVTHANRTLPWARIGPPEQEYERRPSVISKSTIASPTAIAEMAAQIREAEALRRRSSVRSIEPEHRPSVVEQSRRTSFLDSDLVLGSSEIAEASSEFNATLVLQEHYPYRSAQVEQLFDDLERTISEQKEELFALNHYIQQCRANLEKIHEDNARLRENLETDRQLAGTLVSHHSVDKDHGDVHKRSEEFQHALEAELVDNFNLKHRLNVDSTKTNFLRLRLGLLDSDNHRLRSRVKRDKPTDVGDVIARLRTEIDNNDMVLVEQRDKFTAELRQRDEEIEALQQKLAEYGPDEQARVDESRNYSYCSSYEEEEEEEDAEILVVDEGDERMARVRRELQKMRREVRRDMRASRRRQHVPLMSINEPMSRSTISSSRSTQSNKIVLSSFIQRAQPVARKEENSADEHQPIMQVPSDNRLKIVPVPTGTTVHLGRPQAPPKGVSKQSSGYLKLETPPPEQPVVQFATRARGMTISHQSMVSFGLDTESISRSSKVGEIPTPKAETVKLKKLAIPKKRRPSTGLLASVNK